TSGQGQRRAIARCRGQKLGVPLEGIQVFHGSTSFVPNGFGTYHSRAIVMGGSAIALAARKLAAQLDAKAAAQGKTRAQLDLDACAGEEAMATFEQSKRTYTY